MKISEIKPNPDNPRTISPEALEKLIKSIEEFPEMLEVREVVLNKEGMILGGNMRYLASSKMGKTEIPVTIVDWSKEKQKEFIIKDNNSAGEWDWEALTSEWEIEALSDWGLEISEEWKKEQFDISSPYTGKIEPPVYEVKGEEKELEELYNPEKAIALIDVIKKLDIPEAEKHFLIASAYRFVEFNYANIAEYYASAPETTQEIMEKLALVIIDFDKAIENGFIKMTEEIAQTINEK